MPRRRMSPSKPQRREHENDFGFKTKFRHSDVTLTIGGINLYVNTAVLGMVSPSLQRIFDEKLQDDGKQEITLDDEDVQGFIEFLACIYPGCLHDVTKDNVFRILPLADKYHVEFLMKKSVNLLMNSLIDNQAEDHIYQCLSVAKQHSITRLKTKCMELLVEIYKTDIQRADEILTLKEEVKPVVTSAMIPLLRSEASKYRFLVAGPIHERRDSHMDLKDFHDAKYSTLQFKVDLPSVFHEFEVNKTVSSFHVWDVDMNIDMRLKGRDTSFSFTSSGYKYMIAAKMAIKNNTTGKVEDWKQDKGNTELSITFIHQDEKTEGIRWINIVAHVLLNKPTKEPVNAPIVRERRRRSRSLERYRRSLPF